MLNIIKVISSGCHYGVQRCTVLRRYPVQTITLKPKTSFERYSTASNTIQSGKKECKVNESDISTVEISDHTEKPRNLSVFEPSENLDLSNYGSYILPTFNFAAYADQSPTIQEFVKLGVELHKIEQNPAATKLILCLDFEKDVKPCIQFLCDHGVSADDLGKFFTKNPFIFREDLNDLQVRINYLESKKFTTDMITRIITESPRWLSHTVEYIDGRLGYFQVTFQLTGNDVRNVASRTPSIILKKPENITVCHFALKESMGFEDQNIKSMFLRKPGILAGDPGVMLSAFNYVIKTMQVSMEQIYHHPEVLMTRKHILMERHLFLHSLGRAQYNPLLPGYITLTDLVSSDEVTFCEKLAKSCVSSFHLFLKTL